MRRSKTPLLKFLFESLWTSCSNYLHVWTCLLVTAKIEQLKTVSGTSSKLHIYWVFVGDFLTLSVRCSVSTCSAKVQYSFKLVLISLSESHLSTNLGDHGSKKAWQITQMESLFFNLVLLRWQRTLFSLQEDSYLTAFHVLITLNKTTNFVSAYWEKRVWKRWQENIQWKPQILKSY